MRLGSFLKRGITALGLGVALSSSAGCEKKATQHPEAMASQNTRRDIKKTITPPTPKTPEKKLAPQSTREKVKYTFAPPPLPKKESASIQTEDNNPPLPPAKIQKPKLKRKKAPKVATAVKIPALPADRGYAGPLEVDKVDKKAPVEEEIIALNDEDLEDLLDITVTQQPKNTPLKAVKKTGRRPGPPPLKNVRPKKDGKENTLLSSKPQKEKPALLAVNTHQQTPKPKPSGSVVNQQVQIITPPSITPPTVDATPVSSSDFDVIDEGWNELLTSQELDAQPSDLTCPENQEEEIMELCEDEFELLEEEGEEDEAPTVLASTKTTPPPPPLKPTPPENDTREKLILFIEEYRQAILFLTLAIDVAALYLTYRFRQWLKQKLKKSPRTQGSSSKHGNTLSTPSIVPPVTPPAALKRLTTPAVSPVAESATSSIIEALIFSDAELGVEMSHAKTLRNLPEGLNLPDLTALYEAIQSLETLNLRIQELESALGDTPRPAFVRLPGQAKIDGLITESQDIDPSESSALVRHKRAPNRACHILINKIQALRAQAERDFVALEKRLESEETDVLSIDEVLEAVAQDDQIPPEISSDESERDKRQALIAQLDALHQSLGMRELNFESLKKRIKEIKTMWRTLFPRQSRGALPQKYDAAWRALTEKLAIRQTLPNMPTRGTGALFVHTSLERINSDKSTELKRQKEGILTPHSASRASEARTMVEAVAPYTSPRTIEIKVPGFEIERQNQALEPLVAQYKRAIGQINQLITQAERNLPALEAHCAKLAAAIDGLALSSSINDLEVKIGHTHKELRKAWQIYVANQKEVDRLKGILNAAYPKPERDEKEKEGKAEPNENPTIHLQPQKEALFMALEPNNFNVDLSQKTAFELQGLQREYKAALRVLEAQLESTKASIESVNSEKNQLDSEVKECFTAERRAIESGLLQMEGAMSVATEFIQETDGNPIIPILHEIQRYRDLLIPNSGMSAPEGSVDFPPVISLRDIATTKGRVADLRAAFDRSGQNLRGLVDLRQSIEILSPKCKTAVDDSTRFANYIEFSDIEEAQACLDLLKDQLKAHMEAESQSESALNDKPSLRVV